MSGNGGSFRSWLNIAEIELSALSRQCLDRRISDLDTLNTELTAWQHTLNTQQRQIHWQFTTDDARVKLRHLYPKVSRDTLLAITTARVGIWSGQTQPRARRGDGGPASVPVPA